MGEKKDLTETFLKNCAGSSEKREGKRTKPESLVIKYYWGRGLSREKWRCENEKASSVFRGCVSCSGTC